MDDRDDIAAREGLRRYLSVHPRKPLALGWIALGALAAALLLTAYALRQRSFADLVSFLGSVFTGVAVLVAAWQFREQRREVSQEAYFSRLNLPNERRLGYYEQVLALGEPIGKAALAAALEQFYAFYMYAELDNLEYAVTKYAGGQMSEELATRAVKTFVSRCRQSTDFRDLACVMVTQSGYPAAFEELVRTLVGPDAEPRSHPMQHDELAVVRELQRQGV